MSLREQLRDILPQILPSDPAEAIKGTELIRLVRFRLGDEYSDATLRYHFSILSYDTSSPIAKVDQGQGYYFRISKPDTRVEPTQGLFSTPEANPQESTRFARFRAIVERHSLHASRYPFPLHQQNTSGWEIPDLVITDWDFDTDQDENPRLDETLLNIKRHLGVSALTLTGAQLKLSTTFATCNADFFQTLSATRWANHGELLLAEKVSDEALVDILRTLGHQYGVGIASLGVDLTLLDELPGPDGIRRMSAAEFESLQTLLKPQRISVGTHRTHLDWPHLSSLKKKHEGIQSLLNWLNDSLASRQPTWQ
jgi:hypothetical protein